METSPFKNPDRTTLAYALKNLGFHHPDVQRMHQQYFEFLCNKAEKITGRGNIEVYIELAKTYQQAGLVPEALSLLQNGEEGILCEAQNLDFPDLVEEIRDLVKEWSK